MIAGGAVDCSQEREGRRAACMHVGWGWRSIAHARLIA